MADGAGRRCERRALGRGDGGAGGRDGVGWRRRRRGRRQTAGMAWVAGVDGGDGGGWRGWRGLRAESGSGELQALWTGGRRRGWRGRRSRSDVRSRKVVECEAELVAPPSYCIANRFTRDWAVQQALSSVDLASAAGVFARGQLAAMELLFTALWKDAFR
ncbi:Os05g0111700 [Oryza sativa Japonica Group]|uniref:Os05g0111700 protein n=1 Tax=Oryza sativa subsp. japonica TaxID=39947 RepID=A0A0N7KK12_ORYSJ|nr:Os05g0111700 [Oryza sativa Japonica Group]